MLCGFVVSRLQCLQLSLRTRFPFHDSQVDQLFEQSKIDKRLEILIAHILNILESDRISEL